MYLCHINHLILLKPSAKIIDEKLIKVTNNILFNCESSTLKKHIIIKKDTNKKLNVLLHIKKK